MSSILDALNKLEEEKARAQEDAEAADVDVDQAVEELVGRSVFRDRVTLRFSPGKLIVGGGLFVVALVAVSVGVSVAVLRPAMAPVADAPVEALASAELAPAATGSVSSGIDDSDFDPGSADKPGPSTKVAKSVVVKEAEVITHEPSVESSRSDEDASAASTPDKVAVVTSPEAVKEPVSSEPDPAPALAEQQEPVATTSAEVFNALAAESDPLEQEPTAAVQEPVVKRERVARESTAQRAERPSSESLIEAPSELAAPVSIFTLPHISPADLERNGLDKFRINMVKPKSDSNLNGFAIINLKKVYEGQLIPGSRLLLDTVEMEGISLQERGTSLRYFAPF